MDTTATEIIFDKDGVCNFCSEYLRQLGYRGYVNKSNFEELNKITDQIKRSNQKKKYNCLIGVSGGVDSTYLVYYAKQLGLRPLAVHLDNGWNSELAVNNIEMTLKKLDIDLFTHVINWEEFKDLQLSFIKSSTPDLEIPTDHAIYALLMHLANKIGVRYVLTGLNFKDESIMPSSWSYGHADWKYIKNIHKKFGTKKLKTFPHYSLFYLFYTIIIRRVKIISLINYIEYDKSQAIKILEDNLGWRKYEGKHFESIYTRFYQAYYLPRKFNFDKRKAHYSNQIINGTISRSEAINLLNEPFCPEELIEKDKKFILKKFNISEKEFGDYINAPNKSFGDYPNNFKLINNIKKIVAFLRTKHIFPK